MPTVTLVAVPHVGSTAYDPATHTRFRLNESVEVNDETIEARLESLRARGYEFETSTSAAPPAPSAEPTDPPPADVAAASTLTSESSPVAE